MKCWSVCCKIYSSLVSGGSVKTSPTFLIKSSMKCNIKSMSQIQEYQYCDEPRCKVCTAVDLDGKRIRDVLDSYVAKGHTYKELQDIMMTEYGQDVSINSISNHYRKHSPFVRKAKKTIASKSSRVLHARIQQQMVEASGAIQRIINLGDGMVQNWAENKEGPKLPITERLYIEALKEEGRRGTKTTLDIELEDMEEALFEKLDS